MDRRARVPGPALGRVTHVFTHFRLELSVMSAPAPVGEGWWQPLDGLAEAGLPTLYRRAIEFGPVVEERPCGLSPSFPDPESTAPIRCASTRSALPS